MNPQAIISLIVSWRHSCRIHCPAAAHSVGRGGQIRRQASDGASDRRNGSSVHLWGVVAMAGAGMTLEQVWQEINRLHRENDMFTAEQCRQVDALIDKANKLMATKTIGNVSKAELAKGKVKPASKTPKHFKIAKEAKASTAAKKWAAKSK